MMERLVGMERAVVIPRGPHRGGRAPPHRVCV